MDYEDDFLNTVQETVSLIKKRSGAPETYTCKDLTVNGWKYDYEQKNDDETDVANRYFRNGWSRREEVITEDGHFYTFFSYRTEEIYGNSPVKIEEGEHWTRNHVSSFIGTTGKPFAKAKAMLERLPYGF